MPNRKKVERSANYSYYSDLLWCTVPLIGMSWYYSGARPVLLLLAALLEALLLDALLLDALLLDTAAALDEEDVVVAAYEQ